jgi:hypothetical protein
LTSTARLCSLRFRQRVLRPWILEVTMLSDRATEAMHRSVLLRLAEIVLSCIERKIKPEDGSFAHKFMSDGEAATWLVCSLQLAERTKTGFVGLVPKADRAAKVAAVPGDDLPLVEDAIEATLTAHDDAIARQPIWPPGSGIFPDDFDSVFKDLGLKDATGAWQDTALPILVWSECLTDEAIRSEVAAGRIASLALQALATMPQAVMDVILEDHACGQPGVRLRYALANKWRPEGWLTPAQIRVSRTYMSNPLADAVAREIVRLGADSAE